MYLKENNSLYHDIAFHSSEVPNDLPTFADEPIDFTVDCFGKELESINGDERITLDNLAMSL